MSRFNGTKGVDWPHPGLGEDDVGGAGGGATHHKFYQWVTFVLTLQAGMFYLPRCEAGPVYTDICQYLLLSIYCYVHRLLWKTAEGGVMKIITSGLTDITAFMDKGARRDGVELIAKYYNVE